jgi:hypothetical protein
MVQLRGNRQQQHYTNLLVQNCNIVHVGIYAINKLENVTLTGISSLRLIPSLLGKGKKRTGLKSTLSPNFLISNSKVVTLSPGLFYNSKFNIITIRNVSFDILTSKVFDNVEVNTIELEAIDVSNEISTQAFHGVKVGHFSLTNSFIGRLGTMALGLDIHQSVAFKNNTFKNVNSKAFHKVLSVGGQVEVEFNHNRFLKFESGALAFDEAFYSKNMTIDTNQLTKPCDCDMYRIFDEDHHHEMNDTHHAEGRVDPDDLAKKIRN